MVEPLITGIVLFYLILIVLFISLLIVKGIALYSSAKRNQKGWFWVMFLLNTAGILPIIYLIFFRKKR